MPADRFDIRTTIVPIAAGNWAIVLTVVDVNENILTSKTLQEGYADPEQALSAYLDALTYAAPEPPDLDIYDRGLKRIGELAGQMDNVNDAIPQIVERLTDVEEAIRTIGPTPANTVTKRINPLLAGRDAAAAHAAQPKPPARAPAPAIRRVPLDHPTRVHGSYGGGPVAGRHAGGAEPDLQLGVEDQES